MSFIEQEFDSIHHGQQQRPFGAPHSAASPLIIIKNPETKNSSQSRGLKSPGFVSHAKRVALYDGLKRGIDIFGASALLILLSPLMAFVCTAVRLTSRGPAIFTQRRLTEGGHVFHMYKFRTMVVDAESATGPVWASTTDPRITSIGRFLRLSRLDELPQLINVLIGDMSLIGPRPERPEFAFELAEQLPSFHRRLEVKAGITGLAQIGPGYASSVGTYRKKLAHDLMYIKHRCLLLDLRIAVKTIFVILTGSGAR